MEPKANAHLERIEVFVEEQGILSKKDDGLLNSDRGLSRKGEGKTRDFECRPGRNGGHSGCFQRKSG
jgi:hypothetical protein